jgi:hypothetical protein
METQIEPWRWISTAIEKILADLRVVRPQRP